MEHVNLGRTGLKVSRLALGCGNFGGIGSMPEFFGKGETQEEAFELMDAVSCRPYRAKEDVCVASVSSEVCSRPRTLVGEGGSASGSPSLPDKRTLTRLASALSASALAMASVLILAVFAAILRSSV